MPRLFKAMLWIATAGALAFGALLGTLWVDHRRETTLPTPTGAFAVGRTIQAWTDEAVDPLAPEPGTARELMVWIWYPSMAGSAIDDYVPADLLAAINRLRGVLIGSLLTRDLAKVRAHSARDPVVSPQQPSYPVLLMRAGASAGVGNYSALAEDLASRGYVVVGFDAPYRSSVVVFPDGRTIAKAPANDPERCLGRQDMAECAERLLSGWTDDLAFVLDRLARLNAGDSGGAFSGRLDLNRVGVFGHSFGGAAAALFCAADARCKAAVDVDGAPHGRVIQEGLNRPFMFLLSDHSGESGPESLEILANVQSVYEHLPAGSRHRVSISGASHFLFSDDGALLKSPMLQRVLRWARAIGIDGRRQLAVTSYCLRSFFDAYLRDDPPPLTLASPDYPELVEFE